MTGSPQALCGADAHPCGVDEPSADTQPARPSRGGRCSSRRPGHPRRAAEQRLVVERHRVDRLHRPVEYPRAGPRRRARRAPPRRGGRRGPPARRAGRSGAASGRGPASRRRGAGACRDRRTDLLGATPPSGCPAEGQAVLRAAPHCAWNRAIACARSERSCRTSRKPSVVLRRAVRRADRTSSAPSTGTVLRTAVRDGVSRRAPIAGMAEWDGTVRHSRGPTQRPESRPAGCAVQGPCGRTRLSGPGVYAPPMDVDYPPEPPVRRSVPREHLPPGWTGMGGVPLDEREEFLPRALAADPGRAPDARRLLADAVRRRLATLLEQVVLAEEFAGLALLGPRARTPRRAPPARAASGRRRRTASARTPRASGARRGCAATARGTPRARPSGTPPMPVQPGGRCSPRKALTLARNSCACGG